MLWEFFSKNETYVYSVSKLVSWWSWHWFNKSPLRFFKNDHYYLTCFISLLIFARKTHSQLLAKYFKERYQLSTSPVWSEVRDCCFFGSSVCGSESLTQHCLFDGPVVNHHSLCLKCIECPGAVRQGRQWSLQADSGLKESL